MHEGKKVAIIGANSYIARNVIHQTGARYPGVSLALYDYSDAHADGLENYKKVSILDMESLKDVDFDCDVIYVFAGKTGSANGFDDYDSFLDINERALLNILSEYRAQSSSAKIVFPSTRLVHVRTIFSSTTTFSACSTAYSGYAFHTARWSREPLHTERLSSC